MRKFLPLLLILFPISAMADEAGQPHWFSLNQTSRQPVSMRQPAMPVRSGLRGVPQPTYVGAVKREAPALAAPPAAPEETPAMPKPSARAAALPDVPKPAQAEHILAIFENRP